MLLSRNMNEVAMVTGLRMPFMSFWVSMRSSTSVVATRSDLMRAMASCFSSAVSHLAVSGRSVRVKKLRGHPS
jgi:hypothetical protein